MKKYIPHILILALGFFMGWLLFANNANDSSVSLEHHDSQQSNTQFWTCSMHPQIMQSTSGDCPICGMDLIPTVSKVDGLAPNEIKMTDNAMALANIQTSIVGNNSSNEGTNTVILSGKIAENKDETATMPAHFDGRIEKIYVNSLGEQVKKGQLIAEVYSPFLVAAQQELIIASKNKKSQPKLYAAVRNKFENLNIHKGVLDKIEKTGKVISNFPVHSHVNGVVTQIAVDVGAHIMDGMPIFKVSNLNTVWAEFDVYENQISQFKKGQSLTVTTTAYVDKAFDAEISFINPVLNNETRTVTVRATLKNSDRILKPGMFVSAKVKGNSKTPEALLAIPASAVLWTGKRSLVYIKTKPNEAVFKMQEVTLGKKIEENYQITYGLNNGDEIVTNGTFTVDAAAQLQGKKSMMNTSNKIITPITSVKNKLPINFQKGFENTLPSYLKMNSSFIVSNSQEVSSFAKIMLHKLDALSITNLSSIQQKSFALILKKLTAITTTQNIKKQREHAVELNENIVALALDITSPINTLYIQKCPMADNNKGALWLSKEKEIKNPYYGDAMLTCGSIIKTIK